MAELINRSDDLNTGRKKLNEAIKDSNQAKEDAIKSLARSLTAEQIAQLAELKADDTQQQLDNIIIESGTSDAETIQARGDYPLLKDRLNSTDSQLAHKANQTDVADSLALKANKIYTDTQLELKRNKSTKITNVDLDTSVDANKIKLINLSDEVQQALTGNAPALSTIADKSITTEKYADSSVTDEKLSFLPIHAEHGKNLYDKDSVTKGYYIPYDTGVLTELSTWCVSDYIPILPNTQYASLYGAHVVFYNSDKVYLSGVNNTPFTTPSTAVYVRISIETANIENQQLELGIVSTSYEPYGRKPIKLLPNSFSITKEMLDGLESSKNLFNLDKAKRDTTASSTGESPVSGWSCSDYIPVKSLTNYTVSFANGDFAIYYDKNKNYVSKASKSRTANYTFKTPSNARYVRLNIQNAYLSNYMFVAGSTLPSEFVPYSNTIEWLTFKEKSIKLNNLEEVVQNSLNIKMKDKKGVTFGDSITWYDGNTFLETHIEYGQLVKGYQSYMREQLGCIVDNQGYSGARMQNILDDKILPYNFTDVDFVTLTSGANDHRKGTPIGVIGALGSTFNTTTFTGAMQTAIEHILTVKPTIQIYLITPIKGWFHESGTSDVPGPYNNEMMISVDYVNAIKQLGELYSLPVLDWYHLSGINELTKESVPLIGDNDAVFTAYDLHPTNKGYERMANVLIPFLNNN